ncbi:MAG: antibiotic biosynthesis monooxygenase [Hyphomonadaceae bacterium]|nr:antibiotic biosynthesis monooxygenase [Hyphomonadaceae bacterium]
MSFAATPKPPYYAAIFSSIRADRDADAHDAMGERMAALAAEQPGFLGFEFGAETPERFSLFVSYWKKAKDIQNWKKVGAHKEAQSMGYSTWYEGYKIRIAKVERDYGHLSGGPK